MDEVWWTERGGIVYFHWVGSSCKLVKTESKLWHGSILTPFLQPLGMCKTVLVPSTSFTKADPSGAWRAWRHPRHEMCKIRMQWWQGGRRTLRRPVFKTKTLPQKRRVPGLRFTMVCSPCPNSEKRALWHVQQSVTLRGSVPMIHCLQSAC